MTYNRFCRDSDLISGTLGFGTSVTLGPAARRPDNMCENVASLWFAQYPNIETFSCQGVKFALLRRSCTNELTNPTLIHQAELIRGQFSGQCRGCVNQSPTRIALGIGEPGGAAAVNGDREAELIATYRLLITIEPDWDSLSFLYDFTMAPADAILSLTIFNREEIYSAWRVSSEPTLNEDFIDSGLITIGGVQGQEVTLQFDLSSAETGAEVLIDELSFWQSPQHESHEPVAVAGPDQVVVANSAGRAMVELDGSGSINPDNRELEYWWMLDGQVLATGVQAVVDLAIGTYRITLVVWDTVGGGSDDESIVEVLRDEPRFIRGDFTGDGSLDISDPIAELSFLFLGGADAPCQEAGDVDNDGLRNITDSIFSLQYQFTGGSVPPEPGPRVCGLDPKDPSDALSCVGPIRCP